MQNTRQAKKSQNTLEIDTLDYLKDFEERLFKSLERSDKKSDEWREKRELDLENIKNKVYFTLDAINAKQLKIEHKQVELEQKYSTMEVKLSENTKDTKELNNKVTDLSDAIKEMGTVSKKQIVAWAIAGISIAYTLFKDWFRH